MKSWMILALFLMVVAAVGSFVYLNQKPAVNREWIPAVPWSQALTNGSFNARVDAVCFGPPTGKRSVPYEYVLIYLTKMDGTKIALLERNPRSNILSFAQSMNAGSYYLFQDAVDHHELNSTNQP